LEYQGVKQERKESYSLHGTFSWEQCILVGFFSDCSWQLSEKTQFYFTRLFRLKRNGCGWVKETKAIKTNLERNMKLLF
jgi:hypothetical protein